MLNGIFSTGDCTHRDDDVLGCGGLMSRVKSLVVSI